jgi:hypothetical protein
MVSSLLTYSLMIVAAWLICRKKTKIFFDEYVRGAHAILEGIIKKAELDADISEVTIYPEEVSEKTKYLLVV